MSQGREHRPWLFLVPNGITIDRFWRTIFGSWGWGGSLFARGVLASDRPVLDDFRPVFRFVLRPPPLFIARFHASARRFQPFGGLSRPAFATGLRGQGLALRLQLAVRV